MPVSRRSLKDRGQLLESNSDTIMTVDQLLDAAKIDRTKFMVERFVINKYDVGVAQKSSKFTRKTKNKKFVGVDKDETSKIITKPMFQVKVWLKPIGEFTAIIETMLKAAFARVEPPKQDFLPPKRQDVWQLIDIADTHFGKLSWKKETGWPDYDIKIAQSSVCHAACDLIARGDREYEPSHRTIALLGDIFHYDTPQGTTTKGTILDRDGRIQNMINVGADSIISIIETSAVTAETSVVIVPGNHDESLTWALQRVLLERFRNDVRVQIDPGYEHRKYKRVGKTLLGFNHGDKVKKSKLPGLMTNEVPVDWGSSNYREIHTGHFHYQSAEWQRPIEAIDGVVVRIAPVICPADGWHAEMGHVTAPRAMESFFYHDKGGLLGMALSSPDHVDFEYKP